MPTSTILPRGAKRRMPARIAASAPLASTRAVYPEPGNGAESGGADATVKVSVAP